MGIYEPWEGPHLVPDPPRRLCFDLTRTVLWAGQGGLLIKGERRIRGIAVELAVWRLTYRLDLTWWRA
jgi:hypothetical protein